MKTDASKRLTEVLAQWTTLSVHRRRPTSRHESILSSTDVTRSLPSVLQQSAIAVIQSRCAAASIAAAAASHYQQECWWLQQRQRACFPSIQFHHAVASVDYFRKKRRRRLSVHQHRFGRWRAVLAQAPADVHLVPSYHVASCMSAVSVPRLRFSSTATDLIVESLYYNLYIPVDRGSYLSILVGFNELEQNLFGDDFQKFTSSIWQNLSKKIIIERPITLLHSILYGLFVGIFALGLSALIEPLYEDDQRMTTGLSYQYVYVLIHPSRVVTSAFETLP